MQLFPQDNVTLYVTGFEDDILGRKEISKQLSDLVQRIESPLVIALDDDWGTGKSYFLKRWVGAHSKENDGMGITVYFDAFAHDYLSDPLVSLITAFEERIPQDKKADIATRIKIAGAKLAKPALGIALSMLTFGAQKQVGEIGDAMLEAASGEAQKAIDQLWAEEASRQKAVLEFKDALSDLVEKGSSPIVIVVDELDRCRPDYALSVLEVIKHFFAVPKVHFVLGVNGAALQNSVKARYGAGIDAEAYLRKFIHASFSLPRQLGRGATVSVISQFCEKLMEKLGLSSDVARFTKSLLEYAAGANQVSFRDAEKVYARIALLHKDAIARDNYLGFKQLTAFLIVVSVVQPELYQKCALGIATLEELRGFLGADDTKVHRSIDDTQNVAHDAELVNFLELLSACCCSERWLSEEGDRVTAHHRQLFGHYSNKDVLQFVRDNWVRLFKVNSE